MEEIKISCHAKINLGLRIGDTRPDGYHNIQTTFKVIGLHDELHLQKRSGEQVSLISAAENIPLDESNLCIKAVRLLQNYHDFRQGVEIQLIKHIPVGAGLGGGSSDAAGALFGYDRLYELHTNPQTLMQLAVQLGSDVPFFMGYLLGYGNTAFGTGRGEILDYFHWPLKEKILIVYPNIHISTVWAYRHFRKYEKSLNLTKNEKNIIFSATLNRPMFFDNMFEPLVFTEYKEVKQVYEHILSLSPLIAHMSGSGSTIYALFPERVSLESELIAFKDYYVAITRFV